MHLIRRSSPAMGIRVYPAIVCLILLSLLFGCESYTGKQPTTLDKAGFQTFYGGNTPIDFNKVNTESGAKLAIDYLFTKQNQHQHYNVVIEFSPAGKLLVKEEYEKAKNESHRTDNAAKHAQRFPQIGFKAQYYFLGAGPGGAAEKLVFTSSDKRWDVSIVVSNLLPDNVQLPDKNIFDIAKYIDTSLLHGNLP